MRLIFPDRTVIRDQPLGAPASLEVRGIGW